MEDKLKYDLYLDGNFLWSLNIAYMTAGYFLLNRYKQSEVLMKQRVFHLNVCYWNQQDVSRLKHFYCQQMIGTRYVLSWVHFRQSNSCKLCKTPSNCCVIVRCCFMRMWVKKLHFIMELFFVNSSLLKKNWDVFSWRWAVFKNRD